MNNLFRKILSFATIAVLLLSFIANLSLSVPQVFATGNNDQCNDEKTYTVDEDDDSLLSFSETSNRVQVDFNGGSDDRNQAIISAGAGYQIQTVRYDTETNNTNWINFSVSNPTTTINLSGNSDSTRIDKVEVKVKKVCAPWSVAINESVSCGTGQKSFSGSASYGGDTSTTLLVRLNGSTILDNESENTSWSTPNQNLTAGIQYTVTASVYDSSSPDVSGQNQDTPKATDSWTFTVPACAPADVCTNIDGVQADLPANHYFASAGICLPQTGVCTDTNASNYDNDVTNNEYSNNNTCQYPIDLCLNLPDTQTSVPNGYQLAGEGNCVEIEQEPEDVCQDLDGIQTSADECEEENEEPVCGENQRPSTDQNGLHICIDCEGEGTCEVVIGDGEEEEENNPTATPTPTPTPTTPASPHTDGKSDGRTDGHTDGKSDGLGSSLVQSATGTIEATKMAPTGAFGNLVSNSLLGLGLGFTTLAGAFHANRKKV